MGVYIKDIEMPKDKPLIIKINPDGVVSSTFDNDYRKYEAVPVFPHGRLIDVDALKKQGLFYTNLSGSSEYAIPVYALKEAKTIIPSTEPEPEAHGFYW